MLRPGDHLTHHGLDDANVSIYPNMSAVLIDRESPSVKKGQLTQQATQCSSNKGNPEVCREAHDEHGKHGAGTAAEQDGLPADSIGEAAPEHAGETFGEGKSGDEDAGVQRCIVGVAYVEVLHHGIGIWEAGCQCHRLRQSTYRCVDVSRRSTAPRSVGDVPRTKS